MKPFNVNPALLKGEVILQARNVSKVYGSTTCTVLPGSASRSSFSSTAAFMARLIAAPAFW
jgi:hypothetical protein